MFPHLWVLVFQYPTSKFLNLATLLQRLHIWRKRLSITIICVCFISGTRYCPNAYHYGTLGKPPISQPLFVTASQGLALWEACSGDAFGEVVVHKWPREFLQKDFGEVLTPTEFFDQNPMKPQISPPLFMTASQGLAFWDTFRVDAFGKVACLHLAGNFLHWDACRWGASKEHVFPQFLVPV